MAKAAQDEFALELFRGSRGVPIELVGFHAQQAAEKMLKALIRDRDAEYPTTHRLEYLLDLIAELGIDVPPELDDIRRLTPFAVRFRYELVDDGAPPGLSADYIRSLVVRTREWVESLLTSDDPTAHLSSNGAAR